jgi:hypothetical protein
VWTHGTSLIALDDISLCDIYTPAYGLSRR